MKSHRHCVGRKQSPTYCSWVAMLVRVSARYRNAARYHGRGIVVCERWQSFENFLADTGARPTGTTIDRIDNDGNYEPGNCRWATDVEQQRNRSSNRLVTYSDRTQTVTDWARESGMSPSTLHTRLRRGWEFGRAISTPATPVGRWLRAGSTVISSTVPVIPVTPDVDTPTVSNGADGGETCGGG